jgi:hypothetical protein
VPRREAINAVLGARAAMKTLARRRGGLGDLRGVDVELEHFEVLGAGLREESPG